MAELGPYPGLCLQSPFLLLDPKPFYPAMLVELGGVVANIGVPPGGTDIREGGRMRLRGGEAPWGRGSELSPAPAHTPVSPDVDECLEQLDECHYNQICENTPGGHHCGCPRGYWSQGPSLPCLGMGAPTPSWNPGQHPWLRGRECL